MSASVISRRTFLRNTGAAGGGLVIGFTLVGCGSSGSPLTASRGALAPNAFIEITAENSFRFVCPRDEMGQGVTTGLTTLVAEELDVDPRRFEVALAVPHKAYGNPAMGGIQATGGSTSMTAHYEPLRQAGADTRRLLLEAAARDLGAPLTSLRTENGQVHSGGKSYPYADFLATASRLDMPSDTALKPASEFKYIGKDFARLDGLEKATGDCIFGLDIEVPGMLRAVVRRSPVVGGRPVSFTQPDKVSTTQVVELEHGIAVVAEKYWQAKKAADALDIEWSLPELARVDSATVRADYLQAIEAEFDQEAGSQEADITARQGSIEDGLASSKTRIQADYWAPYLAHAPMEPMNAIVHVRPDSAEVWCGTQGIAVAQGLVARHAGLDLDQVTAHSAYLGGAFGRRATLTHVVEATQISMATGKPVQVIWSREDDLEAGVYRPASLMRVTAGVDGEGNICAWQATRVGGNIAPGLLKTFLPGSMPNAVPMGAIDWLSGVAEKVMDGWMVDPTSIEGLYEDYDLPNREVRHITRDHGLPLTFWRSVGHSYTAFAKECMIDELALEAGIDPLELRLRNTGNAPRLHRVLRTLGEHMRQMRPQAGRFLGMAAHHSFATDVAEVAEVSVTDGKIRVHRVLCVVDCGTAVNPDVVKAQMEGSIMYGLTAALYGRIDLEAGKVVQSNFHDYPILRMNEAPDVEVVILNSDAHPTGVGEPGLPPIAPAVANAVFAATGQRLRSLPLDLQAA